MLARSYRSIICKPLQCRVWLCENNVGTMMAAGEIILNNKYKDTRYAVTCKIINIMRYVLLKTFVWALTRIVKDYGRIEIKKPPFSPNPYIVSYTRVIFFWRANAHVTPTLSWHNGLQGPTILYPRKRHDTFTRT